MLKILLTMITAGMLVSSLSYAAEGEPDNWCDFEWGTPPYGMARMIGKRGEKIPFQHHNDAGDFGKDADRCPSLTKCPMKRYLIPDDRVLTSRRYRDFTCSWYYNANRHIGGSAGWIPSSRLSPEPVDANPLLSKWIGHWQYGPETGIDIDIRDGALRIHGDALWQGLASQHYGEITGSAKPDHNYVHVVGLDELGKRDPSGCTAEL